jgi:hypothetical protein
LWNVLNVIEQPAEPEAVLLDAWRNTQRVLVVASRLNRERRRVQGRDLAAALTRSQQAAQKAP